MAYLLDTNACIGYLHRRNPGICQRLAQCAPEDIFLCDVVKFELYYGAYKSQAVDRNLAGLERFFAVFSSLPFDLEAVKRCASLRVQLERQGTPIGPYDGQIAAIALVHDLTLVTHNLREFERVGGLRCEDWEEG